MIDFAYMYLCIFSKPHCLGIYTLYLYDKNESCIHLKMTLTLVGFSETESFVSVKGDFVSLH
jgi:hypothetical protein